jgi:hypothetical protein
MDVQSVQQTADPINDLYDRTRFAFRDSPDLSSSATAFAIHENAHICQAQKVWREAPISNPAGQIDHVDSPRIFVVCQKEAFAFASNKKLLDSLLRYARLLAESFRVSGMAYCRHTQDPETSDQYLCLYIDIIGTDEEILNSEDLFRRELIQLFRPDELYVFRLSYNAM